MREAASYSIFETAIGRCAIVWRGGSILATALPAESDQATLAHLRRRFPDLTVAEPVAQIADAIVAIQQLLAGEPADLTRIEVDLANCPPFERQVYEILRAVPPGSTITYGELAAQAGAPGAARAVGVAMGRNPVPIIVPCHRVLAGSGRSGGFSAPGGVTTKFRILQIEQAGRAGPPLLFDDLPLAVRS